MPKKYRLTREEWIGAARAFAGRLPTEPDEAGKQWAKNLLATSGAFIYRAAFTTLPDGKKQKVVRLTCSFCKGTFDRPYVAHKRGCRNEYGCSSDPFGFEEGGEKKHSFRDVTCPLCGEKAEAIYTGLIRGERECGNNSLLTEWREGADFAVMLWFARKYIGKTGQARYAFQKHYAVTVLGGRVTAFSGGNLNYPFGFSEHRKWQFLQGGLRDRAGRYDRRTVAPYPALTCPEAGTELEKSAISGYLQNSDAKADVTPATYLAEWAKHPNLENLVRQGYADVVSGYCNLTKENPERAAQAIRFDRVRPHEMLGLTVEEFRVFRGCSLPAILIYRGIKEFCGVCLTREEVLLAGHWRLEDFDAIARVVEHSEMRWLVRYLLREAKRRPYTRITPRFYNDYLDMLFDVEGRIDRRMLYPKDLVAAHDSLVRMRKEKENEKISKDIAKRAEKFEKYCFEADGLLIRPCRSHAELIDEGATLSHCVGTYANTVAAGRTMIFFIRRTETPGEPFYTLEWKNGGIAQNHGLRNVLQTPEILAFEQKWLAHVERADKAEAKKKETAEKKKKEEAKNENPGKPKARVKTKTEKETKKDGRNGKDIAAA